MNWKSKLEHYLTIYDKLKNYFSDEQNIKKKLKEFENDYYVDLFRWPQHRARNIAKYYAIRELQLPEKHNFEVSIVCNLKCEFCVLHSGALKSKRQANFMSYEVFKKIFLQMEPFITHIEFTGGEPFLNRDLFKMIELCNLYGVKTTVATNANLLSEEKIKKIVNTPPSILLVAYESGDEYLYKIHRIRGKLDKVNRGIKDILELRKERKSKYPHIQLQTIVSRKTVSALDKFWEIAKELGVDSASIKPLFIWPDGDEYYRLKMINSFILLNHPLSYYKLDENGSLLPTSIPNFCPNIKNIQLGTNGEVIPCFYNLLSSPIMGNVLKKHFFEIWFSSNYIQYRKLMKEHKAYKHKCKYCIGIYKKELFEIKYFNK